MTTILSVIITAILLLLLVIVLMIWLFVSQKKERFFERKSVLWHAFVLFLLFALVGLFGLSNESQLQQSFRIAQGISIMIGGVQLWLLFYNYEWSNRASYLPETIFTFFTTSVGALALFISYSICDTYYGEKMGYAVKFTQSILWLPVPYLVFRTYDLIMEIPSRLYNAWYYTEGMPIQLNYNKDNIIYVYWNMNKDYNETAAYKIVQQRARLSKHIPLTDCFKGFVQDYNNHNEEAPILNLREDAQGNPIGWKFYVSASKKGVKKLLKPYEAGSMQVEEGDFLHAIRVVIAAEDVETASPIKIVPDRTSPDEDNFEIVITEK